MGRVSKPIVVSADDRRILNDLLIHGNTVMKERARIVLTCADETSNKKVAERLGVGEHTVARWKTAYQENGIEGLQIVHGGGRKTKSSVANVESEILSRLSGDEADWTIHTLAEAVGVSDYQVSKVLKDRGISLARDHEWSFETVECVQSSDIEIVGLYMSDNECAVIGCHHPCGINSSAGKFLTENRLLAGRIKEAGYTLSLLDTIVECTYYEECSGSKKSLQAFIETYIQNRSICEGLTYHIFAVSETLELKSILPTDVYFNECEDTDSWLKKLLGWAGSLTNSAHHFAIEQLADVIRRYLSKRYPGIEPFWWTKSVTSVGNISQPIQYIPPKMPEDNNKTIEDIVLSMINGEKERLANRTGFIAFASDENGTLTTRTILNDSSLPDISQFSFDSEEGFLNGMNRLESAVIRMRDHAGITATELYLDQVKKNYNAVGITKEFLIESELGRFWYRLSIHCIEGKSTNKRIKTAGYRKTICFAVKDMSYRKSQAHFNHDYHREGTENELSYGTIAGDIEQEGKKIILEKRRRKEEILSQYHFDPKTGLYPGHVIPEEIRNKPCEMITFTSEDLVRDMIPGWEGEKTAVDEPEGMEESEAALDAAEKENQQKSSEQYSEPDLEEIHPTKKRRGKRIELPPEVKEDTCTKFARWYNSVSKKEVYGIIHDWQIEKDSANVNYISMDVVYVSKQKDERKRDDEKKDEPVSKEVKKNNKDDDSKKIGHVNIKVRSGDRIYLVTSTDIEEAYQQLLAVFLHNKLYLNYTVFFIDGEETLVTHIEKYFKDKWDYVVILDWMHLEHKCYDRLSNAIHGDRVPDPRGYKIYYKTTEKKGQIKKQEYTAISRLYARALIRILWVGNVDEAIEFLRKLNPEVVKSQGEIDRLITYLTNKKEWITSYVLRRKAGLKNSSNETEGQNNTEVAIRQKNNGTSWCEDGSSYLVTISTLFSNHEEDTWFYDGVIPFDMVEAAIAL